MPDEEIVARLAEELQHHGPLTVVMRAESVLHLCGLLQLTLRHPGLGQSSRDVAQFVLAHARAYFADCPAVLEVLDRGDNPEEDR